MDPAYLAGFFDGEGWVCAHLKHSANGLPRLEIQVGCTQSEPHHQVLLDARRLYGGGLYPKANPNPAHSQRWDWRITRTSDVRRFLGLILPHLRIKQERALLALAILDLRTSGLDRAALSLAYETAFADMKRLNLRGAPDFEQKKGEAEAPPLSVAA